MTVTRTGPSTGSQQNVSEGIVDGTSRPRLFVLSASDEHTLRARAEDLQSILRDKGGDESNEWMNSLAYNLSAQEKNGSYRTVVVISSATQLQSRLGAQLKVQCSTKKPTIGFIFTGQGAHWAGMGKELLETYAVFRQSMELIDTYLARLGAPYNVIEEVLRGEEISKLSHPLLSQPIVSALQIALVDLLADWKIYPNAVAGHSSGEVAAAYAAGMLSMEEAMTVAYYRGVTGSALLEKGIRGAMMAVGLSAPEAKLYVAALRTGRATLACENEPANVTVSGDAAAIEELDTFLQDKGIFTRRLAVEVAYHSHHMKLIADEYDQSISHVKALITEEVRKTQFFSSVTGGEIAATDLNPEYWVRNLVEQVKLVDAVKSLCYDMGSSTAVTEITTYNNGYRLNKPTVDTLIEIGPHAELAGPIKQILSSDRRLSRAQVEYGSVLIRGMDARTTALEVCCVFGVQGLSGGFAGSQSIR